MSSLLVFNKVYRLDIQSARRYFWPLSWVRQINNCRQILSQVNFKKRRSFGFGVFIFIWSMYILYWYLVGLPWHGHEAGTKAAHAHKSAWPRGSRPRWRRSCRARTPWYCGNPENITRRIFCYLRHLVKGCLLEICSPPFVPHCNLFCLTLAFALSWV